MFYLAIFSDTQCYDQYLPDQSTWITSVLVPQTVMGGTHDILIHARALEENCYLAPGSGFVWKDLNNADERMIEIGKPYQIKGMGMTLLLLVTPCTRGGTVINKYRLDNKNLITIGRDEHCDISQNVSILSTRHGEIRINNDEAVYQDHSQNGSFLNGRKLSGGQAKLSFGDVLTMGVGMKVIYLGDCIGVNGPINIRPIRLPLEDPIVLGEGIPEETGISALLQYHRAPRFVQMPETGEVNIEGPIQQNARDSMPIWMTIGPSATMVLPMLLSSIIAGRNMSSMLVMMGGTAALSVMWGMVNNNYRKKHEIETEEKRQYRYKKYIRETEDELMALVEKESARLHDQCLSLERCLELPVSTTHRLWERSTTHADFASVRLGTGSVSLPTTIKIPVDKLSMVDDALRDEPLRLYTNYESIDAAPITVNLRENSIVGVIAAKDQPYLLQSIVMQLAAEQSYHDLRIAVLLDEENRTQWNWARWLPHAFINEDRNLRMVVSGTQSVQEVLNALESTWVMRKEMAGDDEENQKKQQEDDDPMLQPLPHFVVVCSNPDLLENHVFMRHVIERPFGFTVVIQATSMERLPKECSMIIQASEQHGGLYNTRGEVTNVSFELPMLPDLERFGHNIAPIRVNDVMENAAIPSLVTFLDVYHVRDVHDLDVWRFWNENHAYEGIKATVGLGASGRPFILDISDKPQSHGPHGLVAGTTGSGKSVMLQTYILALALNYHPHQVQFILIDYKGGGMANAFTGLPHIAGVIDNLQGERSIQRALQSIKGEIKRREAAFKRLGIDHIDDYIRFYNNDPQEEPLGHIIIVVDEFAELKREQPDFMRELVSAARVGRSVGLHLILATQKPANSVDDEIWSNTRFRICLRVASRGDSNDMLKRPDAAYLKGMGRCYVQVGNDEIFEQVQTSYSGAGYAPTTLNKEERPVLLNGAGQPIRIKKKKAKTQEKEVTQMDAVRARIAEVAAAHNMTSVKRLWLDELKSEILLNEVFDYVHDPVFDGQNWPSLPSSPITVPYALLDDTAGQRYMPLSLNVTVDHNYVIVGPAQTGKTTLLQSIAMSLAMRYTPSQVNMYIFSLTGNVLDSMHDLPHVGDIILKDQQDEIVPLINFIEREDNRRRQMFEEMATDSFEQYNISASKSRRGQPLPAIIVMADRLAQILEVLNDDQTKDFYRLVNESASRGIFFIVTAAAMDRTEMPSKIRDNFIGLALRLADKDLYSMVLPGTGHISAEDANIRQVPGRGLVRQGDMLFETQSAVFGAVEDMERAEHVRSMCKKMHDAWQGKRPEGILRVPKEFTLDSLYKMNSCRPEEHDRGVVTIGIAKRHALAANVDFNEIQSFFITGPYRSGKTTTLVAISDALRRQGGQIYFFGTSPLLNEYANKYPEQAKVYPKAGNEVTELINDVIFPEITVRRNQAFKAIPRNDKQAIREFVSSLSPIVLAIDDVEEFIRNDSKILDWVMKTMRYADHRGIVILAAASFQSFALTKAREPIRTFMDIPQGLIMCGHLNEVSVWNVSATSELKRMILPVGEAMMATDQGYEIVALPNI